MSNRAWKGRRILNLLHDMKIQDCMEWALPVPHLLSGMTTRYSISFWYFKDCMECLKGLLYTIKFTLSQNKPLIDRNSKVPFLIPSVDINTCIDQFSKNLFTSLIGPHMYVNKDLRVNKEIIQKWCMYWTYVVSYTFYLCHYFVINYIFIHNKGV